MTIIRKTKYESVDMDFLDNPEIGQGFVVIEEAETSFVSGHSVSEHLKYCIDKYYRKRNQEPVQLLL